MDIIVGRKGDAGAVYMGRGTIYGNPFTIEEEIERTGCSEVVARNRVCDKFQVYFDSTLKHDPVFIRQADNLLVNARDDDRLVLGCFCAPRRCHLETIQSYLIEREVELEM